MIRKIVQRIKLFSSNRKEFYLFLKSLLGFYPNNLRFYDIAFIHKSASATDKYGNTVNNERLEYLGDAILGAIIADFLYNRFPLQDEGFLTKLRSKLVNRMFLTQLTIDMGLDVFINANTNTNLDKSHIYGDALEALIGAIYLDRGFNDAKYFVTKRIISEFVNLEEVERVDSNYKSQIIEWCQKEKKDIEFDTNEEISKNSNYATKFIATIKIDDKAVAKGTGKSKKIAQQIAAKTAVEKLKI